MALLAPRDYVIDDTAPILPDTALIPNMSSVRIAYANQPSAPTVSLANALDSIVGHYNGVSFEGAPGASVTLLDKWQVAEFVSDQTARRWMMQAVSPAIEPRHLFTATPQAASAGTALTLTFEPSTVGQPNEFFTLSADNGGTRLTSTMDISFNYDMIFDFDVTISTNNSDVSWRINPVHNQSTPVTPIVPPLADAFAHSRAATFEVTRTMPGQLLLLTGEWVRFDFTRPNFSNSSDATITQGGIAFHDFRVF